MLRDITGNYTASFEVAGIFVILGTLVTTMLPHFFSRTAPPPLASPRTPGQDTKDAESALMKSPSSFSEGLNHLDTLPFTEPQLDRSSLNLDQGDLPRKQGRSEVDNDC